MNTEKKFYTLCGADVPLEDWVQTMDELQNAFNLTSYDDLLGVNPDPLLFYHQIPSRWLQTDPGFNILLRSAPPQDVSLPLWVLKPD